MPDRQAATPDDWFYLLFTGLLGGAPLFFKYGCLIALNQTYSIIPVK